MLDAAHAGTMSSTLMVARPAPRLGHGTGFWVVAAAFLLALAFSTVPTPLYPLYQQRDGFPTVVITVVFAAYALGVVASMYLIGHVSDWLGRRRMALAAVLAEAVSAAVFLAWPNCGPSPIPAGTPGCSRPWSTWPASASGRWSAGCWPATSQRR